MLKLKAIFKLLLIITAIIIITTLIYFVAFTSHNYLGFHDSDIPLAEFNEAAVTTDSPYCAKYGREILQRNGSAIDAAISVLLCMGVVLPHSMGLGGGCFIVYYDRKTKKATVIDGRETAPINAHENMYDGDSDLSKYGGKSIAVPGELSAYWEAHKLFGKRPWNELFEGAIDISETGFEVHHHLIKALDSVKDRLKENNPLRHLFTDKRTGNLVEIGHVIKRPDLAKTFRRLAASDINLFYKGEMAKEMVKEIQENGGIITEEDLATYKVRVYPARNIKFGEHKLFTIDPPGSGTLLGLMLKMFNKLEWISSKAKKSLENAVNYYQQILETFKHVYGIRSVFEDKNDRIDKLVEKITTDEFSDYLASSITLKYTYDPSHYGENFITKDDHGTAHVNVVDSEGNAVSVTSTINLFFGSLIYSQSTGIIYNDEMDDFSVPNVTNYFNLPPSKYNLIAPNKRPLSSSCPSIIVDSNSDVKLVIGGAGGTLITSSSALVIARYLFAKDDMKTAIDAPRIHHQLRPNHILFEHNFDQDIIKRLNKIGHVTKLLTQRTSIINAIFRFGKKLGAFYDYRKGGSYAGL